jgi:hypothetical protein
LRIEKLAPGWRFPSRTKLTTEGTEDHRGTSLLFRARLGNGWIPRVGALSCTSRFHFSYKPGRAVQYNFLQNFIKMLYFQRVGGET